MPDPLDVLYLRVSSEEQRRGETIRGQRQDAERYITYAQLADVLWLADDGVSGRLRFEERPDGARLLALLAERRVRTVVVTKIDRLGRSALEILRAVQAIDGAGARLVSIKEGIDLATPIGRFFLTVLAAFAEMELDLIRERTLSGKRARVASGKVHSHGHELYGYRRDKERGVREIVASEAAVVRDVFAWVASGQSVRSVIRRLNDAGTPSPATGKRVYRDGRTPSWGTGVIHRILREPAYKGAPLEWRWRRVDASGRRALRPSAEWETLPPGTVPAIVDAALWDAANARLGTGTTEARNAQRPYLLRGLVWCVCGCSMQPQPEHGRTVYRCRSRETPGGACGGRRAPGADLEAWVWSEVEAVLRDPSTLQPAIREVRAAVEQATKTDRERAKLVRELDGLDRQLARLARLFGETDDEQEGGLAATRAEMDRVERQQRQLRERIALLDRRATAAAIGRERMTQLEAYCARAAATIGADPPFATKRRALQALGVRVTAEGRDWKLFGAVPLGDTEAVLFERPA